MRHWQNLVIFKYRNIANFYYGDVVANALPGGPEHVKTSFRPWCGSEPLRRLLDAVQHGWWSNERLIDGSIGDDKRPNKPQRT